MKIRVQPPSWPLKLLRFFVRREFVEEIEGDMEEEFRNDIEKGSSSKARWRYTRAVFSLIRPSLVRLVKIPQTILTDSISLSFTTAVRRFKRFRTTFFINLLGLSSGLAAAILMLLWVSNERSVDTFHNNNDRLYWAWTHFQLPGEKVTWDYTSGRLAEALLEDFSEVKETVRVGNRYFIPRGVVSYENKHLEMEGLYASSNFFSVLTYPLIYGKSNQVLTDKNSIVLSKKYATRMFGNPESAVGRIINWETSLFNREFTVSGVFEDPPKNATKQFDAVVSYDILVEVDRWADHWNGGYAETYLVMNPDVDIAEFNTKIKSYLHDKHNHERFELFVRPYASNYLYGEFENGHLTGGRIENVRLFTIIAFVVILIAIINFMNLSTAQASQTMKQTGVRKAIGASRSVIAFNFLFEALLMSFISTFLALLLVWVLLPQFNSFTGKHITMDLTLYLDYILAGVLLIGVIAGSYPAIFLSSFKPASVLRGKMPSFFGELLVRKGLVMTQFAASTILIIGVLIINQQISFTQSRSLGYDREQIITFERKGTDFEIVEPMLNDLKQIPGLTQVSNMAGDFLWGYDSQSGYSWMEGDDDNKHLFKSPKIGYNLIETLGIELSAGRSFSKEFQDGESKVIINESAVRFMGLEEPVGFMLDNGDEQVEIIGVVKDFQYGSLHQKIEPLIFRFREGGGEFMVKVQPGAEQSALAEIEKVYKKYMPNNTFEPIFLEDEYMNLYDKETKTATLSNFMAIVSIIICCLGVLGLSSHTAERRRKEIGIRKVLGASAVMIVRMLVSSFSGVVLASMIISIPLGYLLMKQWLQNFAYSIEPQPIHFILAAFAALLLAWATIAIQTLKVATSNPVDSIRE